MTQPQQDPMEKLKHADGVDCQCYARSASECGCDADWTSGRVYELEAELAKAALTVGNWKRLNDTAVAELADLRQVAQGLREKNGQLYDDRRDRCATMQSEIADLQAKHSYAIGEWKKEEVLWKERESDLLAKLSVAREALKAIVNDEESYLGTVGDGWVILASHQKVAKQALAQIEGTK